MTDQEIQEPQEPTEYYGTDGTFHVIDESSIERTRKIFLKENNILEKLPF